MTKEEQKEYLNNLIDNDELFIDETTKLRYANLIGANLYKADLRNADLRNSELIYADLVGVYLRSAYLWKVNLSVINTNEKRLRLIEFLKEINKND